MEAEYSCRSIYDQALDALTADEIRQVGERVTRTGDYRCRCCRRSRLFVLGDTVVECSCHHGAIWWGFYLDEQTL
jgi:hypothetical protein